MLRPGFQFHVRRDVVARLRDHRLTFYAYRSREALSWEQAVARAAAEASAPSPSPGGAR
jgi:hypothetical protein